VESVPVLEYDTVHVTNTGFAGWLGIKLSEIFEIPLLLTEHALYWKEVEKGAVALECGYQIPDNFEAKSQVVDIFKQIAKEVYASAEEVISVSRVNIPLQKEFGAEYPKYIPNGIPEDLLSPEKQRAENPVIGWIGRCAEMKNPKLFFEIVESFRESSLEPEFLMMLSGANEKELELEVKSLKRKYPEVKMIWDQPAHPLLYKFDMICITSHNESQPLVMFEAISHKALPIGWEVGDLTSEFGFVVPKNTSTQTLVDQVTSLWKNPDKFNELTEAKYELVSERHIWSSIFNRYDNLFKELLIEDSL
jgi:glycosyltransferase involved in cell wall biosynthesis